MTLPTPTIRAIKARKTAGYNTNAIAVELGITTETVRAVLRGDVTANNSRPPAPAGNVNPNLYGLAIRLMKEAEAMRPGKLRQEQIASVKGNFCDVVPSWR